MELNGIINQMVLRDIYRTFHQNNKKCSLFSAAHDTCFKINHILGHKASLDKFKKTEINIPYPIWPQKNKAEYQQ